MSKLINSKRTCSKCGTEKFIFEFPYGQDPKELICLGCFGPIRRGKYKKQKPEKVDQPAEPPPKPVEYVVRANPEWLEDLEDWT